MQASRVALWQTRRRLSQAIAASPSPFIPTASTSSSPTGTSFFLAALPWRIAEGQDRQTVIQNARFQEGNGVVASSISTSRRLSPIANSLAMKLGSVNTNGGAWLLMRASSQQEAVDIMRSRCSESWDVEKADVQSIDFAEDVLSTGPLYSVEQGTSNKAKAPAVDTSGPLYGK